MQAPAAFYLPLNLRAATWEQQPPEFRTKMQAVVVRVCERRLSLHRVDNFCYTNIVVRR
jgi:hypothetical protein